MLMLSMMVLLSTLISYDVALLVRDQNSMGALVNTAGQPISLLAGVLIPLALAPLWVRDAALWNPFAWATNGMRALFNGDLSDHVVWQGAAIITVLALVTVVWSSRLFAVEKSPSSLPIENLLATEGADRWIRLTSAASWPPTRNWVPPTCCSGWPRTAPTRTCRG